jgi:uncharacterized protein
MQGPSGTEWTTQKSAGTPGTSADLIRAAYASDLALISAVIASGVPVSVIDDATGLSALHVAAGTNNLALCRFLIEVFHAPFGPDKFGRWPTLVAAECRAGEALSDYIVEQEAKFLEGKQP